MQEILYHVIPILYHAHQKTSKNSSTKRTNYIGYKSCLNMFKHWCKWS